MKHIVILNQHGSNRGDEAACRGMLHGLTDLIPDCRIDIYCVYPIDVPQTDRIRRHDNLPLRGASTPRQLLRIAAGLLRMRTGVGLAPAERELVQLLRQADLVISAPGGPYLGDLYIYTEQELIYHLLAARLFGKPYMIYAPSMGPFRISWRNRVRRWLINGAATVTVREDKTAAMLAEQLGIVLPPERITCDSALQKPVAPPQVDLAGHEAVCRGAIGFVPLETERFATEPAKAAYIAMLIETMRRVVDELGKSIVMFPQGYAAWRDLPFLERLAAEAERPGRVTILPETLNADQQQSLIGCLDGMISFRYHPGIFAVRQGVPSAVIAYEHKARGFMAAAGLAGYCLDLDGVTSSAVLDTLRRVMDHRTELVATLPARLDPLAALSRRNSELAAALVREQA